ncbi:hypothetical protein CRM22_008225 [Opisthorchis felineus]|uniref:G-patch domain-containing protein n=1 Tax=Opisthorchis felineus TaxID=147828 RepID=A0A4S2LKG9_OPIFE|nr:hypothetical protein CRM22_008225 [Opisthorchis felineus]
MRPTEEAQRAEKMWELGPWHEPDVTKFSREGQLCLVKNNHSPYGLWRHARLLHADLDSQSCVVEWGHAFAQGRQSSAKRKSYTELEQSVANVSLDAVHLLSEDEDSDQDDAAEHEDVSSSSSDSDTSDGNQRANWLCNSQSISTSSDKTHRTDALNLRSKVTFVAGGILAPEDILKAIPYGDPISDGSIPTTDSDVPDTLGAWEAHTRGIGSRLLARLGYDGTSGLGSCGQGRTLPVALLLEKFQIRPRKWNKRPTLDLLVRPEIESKRHRRQKRNLATVESSGHDSSSPLVEAGVFNLLNTALNRCDDDVVGSKAQHSQSRAAQSGSRLTELSESASRIETFKVQEEIDRTLRKMKDVQQSIERNLNKDRVIAKQAEQRLNNLQAHLAKLRHSERVLQNSRQKVAKTKKLRIF